MEDVMLDLETFGTRHDAMIVQIGACYFDRETGKIGDTFKGNIVYGNDADGDRFSIDQSTVMWWLNQSAEARESIRGDAFDLPTILRDLHDFLNRDGIQLWSHATFDMPILANAFETIGLKLPVPYRRMRDLRTLMDLSGHISETPRQGTHHDALADSIYQATYASEAFRKLYGGA